MWGRAEQDQALEKLGAGGFSLLCTLGPNTSPLHLLTAFPIVPPPLPWLGFAPLHWAGNSDQELSQPWVVWLGFVRYQNL